MRRSTLFLSPRFNFAVMRKNQDVETTDLFKVAFQSSAKLEAHNGQPDPRIGINQRTISSRSIQDFNAFAVWNRIVGNRN